MLLKSLVLHYHGLDDEERDILAAAAKEMDSEEELEWANHFISEDYLSAFERARDFFSKNMARIADDQKLRHLKGVWEDNLQKGYVTEMETTAMINLAKDWGVEREFLKIIKT